jgi:monofunctional biosynthetic peptidoglycan transglycosylase
LRSHHLPFDGRSSLSKAPPKKKQSLLTKILLAIIGLIFLLYFCCACLIFSLRSFNPPTTAVQLQRQISALIDKRPYQERSSFVTLSRIAPDLQYAVIAAEDGRFYVHHGFDWLEMQKVMKTDLAKHTVGRGASTITQQLAKNMFLGTERSYIRKGIEFTLVPLFELMLTKYRILELYLNVIEWGPGIFGAEAASEHWYKVTASELSRDQASRLAAIIPNPLRRAPAREDEYSEEIQARMKTMGW